MCHEVSSGIVSTRLLNVFMGIYMKLNRLLNGIYLTTYFENDQFFNSRKFQIL